MKLFIERPDLRYDVEYAERQREWTPNEHHKLGKIMKAPTVQEADQDLKLGKEAWKWNLMEETRRFAVSLIPCYETRK